MAYERRKPKMPAFFSGGSQRAPDTSNPNVLRFTVTIKDSKEGDAVLRKFQEEVQALNNGQRRRYRGNYGPLKPPTLELLTERLQEGWERWVDSFSYQLDVEMATDQFAWPISRTRITNKKPGIKRRNGSFVQPPINVIDTGRMLRSKDVTVDSKNLKAYFRWGTTYSGWVYEGWVSQAGFAYPGRDFITPALKNTKAFRVFYGTRTSSYKPR